MKGLDEKRTQQLRHSWKHLEKTIRGQTRKEKLQNAGTTQKNFLETLPATPSHVLYLAVLLFAPVWNNDRRRRLKNNRQLKVSIFPASVAFIKLAFVISHQRFLEINWLGLVCTPARSPPRKETVCILLSSSLTGDRALVLCSQRFYFNLVCLRDTFV